MSQDSGKWKEKYLDSVDELERLQQQSEQQKELLQRVLAKVSVAAQGQDGGLDEVLGQLRSLLHEDRDATTRLELLIEQLDQQTVRLDDNRLVRTQQLMNAVLQMIEQLRVVAPQRDLQKQLKQLAKTVRKQFEDMNERGELLTRLAQQQALVIEGFQHGTPNRPGLLSRLFGQSDGQNKDSDAATNDAVLPDKTDELQLAAVETTPQTSVQFQITRDITPGFAHISEQLVCVIENLMDQIEVPEMALVQAARVRQALKKGLNWYELVPTLEDISIVVLAALDQDHQEFGRFLQSLDQRLQEVQTFLMTAQHSQDEAIDNSRRMDETVRQQVSTLAGDMSNAADLESLKISVKRNLDHIIDALDQFQVTRETNEGSVVDQLAALVDKVANMEKESQQTKSYLEEQRQRLLLDSLTQLPNRESYENRLAQEYERWQRYKRPFSLVVGDVDFFKSVNDNYGHLAGDKVLRVIAKTLAKRLRKTDFVSRYGGEEFVILMPETSCEQAFSTMEAVREAIAQCPFHFRETRINVTMSFGIAQFKDTDKQEQVFERADKALYAAKKDGRNCCKMEVTDEVLDDLQGE